MKALLGTVLVLSNCGIAMAQMMAPPTVKEARTATELVAYNKAMCVYRALTEAGNVFTPASDGVKITPEVQARAKTEIDMFEKAARKGVRSCLSEQDVYDLGRYSYFEDVAFADGSPCGLAKAPAAKFERTPNNNDGDIVNGATRWADVNALDEHPFFRGQSEAREQFKWQQRSELCRAMVAEYGPNGSRFAGLVRAR